MATYRLDVKQFEDGDLYIEFPDELLGEVNWKEGDTLVWTDLKNGSWSLSKKDDKHLPCLLRKDNS
jgi:hypothetical protein